jgi:hydroxyacylglutathione hydrolase
VKVIAISAWVAATNGYLVFDESVKVATLVDAPPEPELIADVALQHGLSIGSVLLTHGHIDHTGGAGQIEKQFGAQVYVHRDDDFLTLHPIEQVTRMFGMRPPGSYELPTAFENLVDGQMLKLAGGLDVEVRQTPGHTPGHCCFYSHDEGALFSGDQLFAGSVGRTDLPGGNTSHLFESMSARVLTLDDDVRVLPGHGGETTIGRERRTNPFLQNL